MKISKIFCICFLLVILSVGIVSAVDIDEFKAPSGFDDGIGESMDKDDFSITIEEYDKDFSSPFKGDHFHNITVKGKMAEVVDSFNDEVAAMELIKVGKTHQVVKCKYKGNDTSKIAECVKYLEEFNKKNNLEPETIK